MNPQPKTPESDSGETRERLLEAATRLFAEHGFKGVSVRELCAEADANVAAVQYHFGGKQGLYRTLFSSALDEDEARFQAAMAEIDAVIERANGQPSRLAHALDLYIQSFFARFPRDEQKRAFFVLVLRELSFPGEAFELIYARRAQPSLAMLAKLVAAREGIAATSESAKLQAQVLSGAITSTLISRNVLLRQMGWQSFQAEQLEQLTSVVSQFLYRALELTPP